jgi:hypothetical protein
MSNVLKYDEREGPLASKFQLHTVGIGLVRLASTNSDWLNFLVIGRGKGCYEML